MYVVIGFSIHRYIQLANDPTKNPSFTYLNLLEEFSKSFSQPVYET
jgi:hypothetical protein